MFKSSVLSELSERGLIASITNPDRLDEVLLRHQISVYAGFDCTADSLHVGSMLPLEVLAVFKKHGHKIIAVVGTATTLIGDPSGKTSARPILTEEEVAHNAQGIRGSIFSILGPVEMHNNHEWLSVINWINFLRDFGRHIPVNSMLHLDSVKNRLETGMSFLEFNYSLFQAFDFFKFASENEFMLQVGGSDQWGNITMGTELIRKKLNKEAWGLTIPLLTNADGNKMGKTETGAVWLNPPVEGFQSFCSNFEFWQFWRNVADADIIRFCKMLLNIDIIAESAVQFNSAKKLLATGLTDKVRGVGVGLAMQQQAYELFEANTIDNLPTIVVIEVVGESLVKILKQVGIVSSINEGNRLINNNGIKVNDVKVDDIKRLITQDDFVNNKLKVSVGKKKHYVLQLD
jgi:tyrosyl-tRNA synthetase